MLHQEYVYVMYMYVMQMLYEDVSFVLAILSQIKAKLANNDYLLYKLVLL